MSHAVGQCIAILLEREREEREETYVCACGTYMLGNERERGGVGWERGTEGGREGERGVQSMCVQLVEHGIVQVYSQ